MRLAIFGGTFDPIHCAHLAIAKAAADRFQLNKVVFVPAANPPHKPRRQTAPYEDRLRMVELACEDEPLFESSDIERNTAKSYSIDTIERVVTTIPADGELFFLIGADAFADIQTWRRWQDVVQIVTFIVVSRPGHSYDFPEGARVLALDDVRLPTSSSAIRKALDAGDPTIELPPKVAAYIEAKDLY